MLLQSNKRNLMTSKLIKIFLLKSPENEHSLVMDIPVSRGFTPEGLYLVTGEYCGI